MFSEGIFDPSEGKTATVLFNSGLEEVSRVAFDLLLFEAVLIAFLDDFDLFVVLASFFPLLFALAEPLGWVVAFFAALDWAFAAEALVTVALISGQANVKGLGR